MKLMLIRYLVSVVLGLSNLLRIAETAVPGSNLNITEEDLRIASITLMESLRFARNRGIQGPIIATGWPHSGTRAGAAVLASLGVYMGSHIRRQSLDEMDIRAHQGPGRYCQSLTKALWYIHKSGFGPYRVGDDSRYELSQILTKSESNDISEMTDNEALENMFKDCRNKFLNSVSRFINSTVKMSMRKTGPGQEIWGDFWHSDWIAYGGKNPSSLSVLQALNDFFAIGTLPALPLDDKPRVVLATTNELNHTSSGCFKIIELQSPSSVFKVVVVTRDIRDLFFPTMRIEHNSNHDNIFGCNVPLSILNERMERVENGTFGICVPDVNSLHFKKGLKSAACWSLTHEDLVANFHESIQADLFIFRVEGLVKEEKSAIEIIRHLASYVTGQPHESLSEESLRRVRNTAICGGYIGVENNLAHVKRQNPLDEIANCSAVSSFYGRWRNSVGEMQRCNSYVTRVAYEGLKVLGYDVL